MGMRCLWGKRMRYGLAGMITRLVVVFHWVGLCGSAVAYASGVADDPSCLPEASIHASSLEEELEDTLVEAPYSKAVQIKCHNPTATGLLNLSLSEESFWKDAWTKDYKKELFDEIRMKQLDDGGYFPMITGESDMDLPHDVVSHIVFNRQDRLTQYMSGAKAVVRLGSGYDEVVGAEYHDYFYYIDLTLFYATMVQRMYRYHDPEEGVSVMWFEKLQPDFVDEATYKSYLAKKEQVASTISRRWPPFNAVFEVSDIYGMFVVHEGSTRESRVTFVTKLVFGTDSSWIARWGSQMPPVIRGGLKSGFNASALIARDEHFARVKAKTESP
jgi:hypothetical protein